MKFFSRSLDKDGLEKLDNVLTVVLQSYYAGWLPSYRPF